MKATSMIDWLIDLIQQLGLLPWCLFFVFVLFFMKLQSGVHAVLSLSAVLLIFSLPCFIKNHHSCGNPGCGFTGIQREIALSGSGGAAQLPGGSISRSTIHCNLYLRHVWTWLSDCGNFICNLWNIAPCRNRLNSENGIWMRRSELFHYERLCFYRGILNWICLGGQIAQEP